MILIANDVGSKELAPHFTNLGMGFDLCSLDSADFAFEGYGPKGRAMFGIERKTVGDLLNCIDDHRYNAQRMRMAKTYAKSFLIMEGSQAPDNLTGHLMEYMRGGWNPFSRNNSRPVLYSKLHNYLLSVAYSGVIITYTKDQRHTAFNVTQTYHYHQKQWTSHTSLLEIQKLAIPTLDDKPSLCRKWASDLTDIGVKYSQEAERIFHRKPIKLAQSSELDWLRIKGVGVATAQRVIKEIWG